MWYVIATLCVVAVLVILGVDMYRHSTKNDVDGQSIVDGGALVTDQNSELTQTDFSTDEFRISVELLPADSIIDKNDYVEVTNKRVLARLNKLVPDLGQAAVAGMNMIQAAELGKGALYHVIIPNGAKLAQAQKMPGAFRALYHAAGGGINGHAALVAAKAQPGMMMATNAISAVMEVASIVVGQYYMSQINAELGKISDDISKIADFQENEFHSKVLSLMARVKKVADFEVEIIENDELRQVKLNQLDDFEAECTQLLGQANQALLKIAKSYNQDYENYENRVNEANKWFMYQNVLFDMLCKISDLMFTMNRGTVSREQCRSLVSDYAKQVKDTLDALVVWHQNSVNQFGINIEKNKRQRDVFGQVLYFVPALFNEDFKYQEIEEKTALMIEAQRAANSIEIQQDNSDLYAEDVHLISQDGKIYYLPSEKTGETEKA